jgi:hypothetical protein
MRVGPAFKGAHYPAPETVPREYDFRYNERSALGVEDAERMTKSVQGIVGKRLTYKDSSGVGG